MGHHQVEGLSVTDSHQRVVGMLGEGAGMAGLAGVGPGSLEEIAAAMLDAAIDGIERAKSDDGLTYTFYLLTQVTQAARADDFAGRLAALGVGRPATAVAEAHPDIATADAADTLYELVAHFTHGVDQHLATRRTRSDLSEIAQRAAAQSLTTLCKDRSTLLWGTGPEAVQVALRDLSTKNGFARLSKDFFARATSGFLLYHLSKELSNHVGPGRRFKDITEHNAFLSGLEAHCQTAATALSDFSGTWYSKHNFQGGITRRKCAGFIAHALDKMRDSLRHLGGSHAA